jgi:hypothetical protein
VSGSIAVGGGWGWDADADADADALVRWCSSRNDDAFAFASGADIISDLKGLFLPPNMMLPLLENETAPKSSHRLSLGIGVVIGAKELAVAVAEDNANVKGRSRSCSLSALKRPGPGGSRGPLGDWGDLGVFGDLGEPRTGAVSPGDAALSESNIFFRNRFDPSGAMPKVLLSFLTSEKWRVGDGASDGVGESMVVSGLLVRGGIETVSGDGATRSLLDGAGLGICSSLEYTGCICRWSMSFKSF